MADKTSVLSKFASVQKLGNNNLINLDLLGNIYEIYANLTVTTPLNLNHFWIKQAELFLKGTFVKASFMFVTIFLDMKILGDNVSCLKHPKIIKKKKWLFSHFFVVPHKVLSIWGTKCENKKICHFFPLFVIGTTRAKTVFLSNSRLMPFLFP